MGIASDDHVYTWYRDGTVSSGTSADLDAYRTPYAYALPPGWAPVDIVSMRIASNNHVYAWYRDGMVSSGNSADLDAHRRPYRYAQPLGHVPDDLVGMGIARNDHVYSWLVGRGIGAPIILTAHTTPASPRLGEKVSLTLKAADKNGMPVPGASVVITATGGNFPGASSGTTNTAGLLQLDW
jgi:hypothetical protein